MSLVKKFLIEPGLARKIPGSFAWIDRQFLAQGYFERLHPEASLLYLFLVIVADRDGLSFYSDKKISKLLKICLELLPRFRAELIGEGLIAYQAPIYQVLSLELVQPSPPGRESLTQRGTVSIGDILHVQDEGIVYGRRVLSPEKGAPSSRS